MKITNRTIEVAKESVQNAIDIWHGTNDVDPDTYEKMITYLYKLNNFVELVHKEIKDMI